MCKAKQSFREEVLVRIDDLYVNFKTESIVIEEELTAIKKKDIKELGQKFATK